MRPKDSFAWKGCPQMFRFYLIGAMVLVLLGAFAGVYWKGYTAGKSKCQVEQLEDIVEHKEKVNEIRKDVIRAPIPELRRRYCEWVRDDKELCLRADIPISP